MFFLIGTTDDLLNSYISKRQLSANLFGIVIVSAPESRTAYLELKDLAKKNVFILEGKGSATRYLLIR